MAAEAARATAQEIVSVVVLPGLYTYLPWYHVVCTRVCSSVHCIYAKSSVSCAEWRRRRRARPPRRSQGRSRHASPSTCPRNCTHSRYLDQIQARNLLLSPVAEANSPLPARISEIENYRFGPGDRARDRGETRHPPPRALAPPPGRLLLYYSQA